MTPTPIRQPPQPVRTFPKGAIAPDTWEPLDLDPWPVTYPVHLYALPIDPPKWTVTRGPLTKRERVMRWARERLKVRHQLAEWR